MYRVQGLSLAGMQGWTCTTFGSYLFSVGVRFSIYALRHSGLRVHKWGKVLGFGTPLTLNIAQHAVATGSQIVQFPSILDAKAVLFRKVFGTSVAVYRGFARTCTHGF